ncbi:hypothetical protein B0T14DRAFT_563277 [Immersiella caudata]|uniref:Uncharacterized protein n=1 Tax=Immersiella caudata TaxID=314043 RepID=A0AA40C6L6_9PEZI|nr:hypothetical protein B0T14DRAFT_563277 [Immersiella caudata]
MAPPTSLRQARVTIAILLLLLFKTSTSITNCDQGSFIIATKQDADALNDCTQSFASKLSGDIIIAPSAIGDLYINYHRPINGAFIAEKAPFLTTLVFQQINISIYQISARDIVLRNLSSLTRYTHHTRSLNSMLLHDLPSLKTVDSSPVHMIGTLEFENLPRLQELSLAQDSPMSVSTDLIIRNVWLGSDAVSSLFSALLSKRWPSVIEGIPNVDPLFYGLIERKSVNIMGNGNLTLLSPGQLTIRL